MYNELDLDGTKAKLTREDCRCATCEKVRFALGVPQQSFGLLAGELVYQRIMIVCQKCGDKRCPHATNHIFSCQRDKDGVE